MTLNKGDVIECGVESLALGGRGVARVDGMAVFVAGAIPGQRVRARIEKAKKRFAEAVTEEVLIPSPHQREPFCPHFGVCGGCMHQQLAVEEQLRQKDEQVRQALARLGGVEFAEFLPPTPSPESRWYRNKMEFHFEGFGGEKLHLGLKESGPEGRVVDVTSCFLLSETAVAVVNAAREYCRETGAAAYDPRRNVGFWRHLVVRHVGRADGAGQVLVHCITGTERREYPHAKGLGKHLRSRFPEIASFVHSTRRSRRTLVFGERTEAVLGKAYVEERLGDIRYRISPDSFFQTNTAGAERLFGLVRELAGLTGAEHVYDLYCGGGGIALFLADRAASVFGVEFSEQAVEDAAANTTRNALTNCEFAQADLGMFGGVFAGRPAPDVVVCDPPRTGMDEPVIEELLRLAPKRIVAVSCNPATLARDVARLAEAYAPLKAGCVDLFPHTPHVECVAQLERRG